MGAKAIAERLTREGHDYRDKRWRKNRVPVTAERVKAILRGIYTEIGKTEKGREGTAKA